MSLINEINSLNIGAISSDEVLISIDKGAMLPYIKTKSRDKEAKSSNKGAISSDKGALSVNKGAMSSDKGAMLSDKGAMSVGKAQKLIDFEVFDNLRLL